MQGSARPARALALLSAVSLGALLASMPAARAYIINNATETVPGSHSSPWALGSTERLSIGTSGTGALTIGSGGVVTSNDAYLAYSAGSTGILTVTGGGSLTTTGAFVAGNGGTGTVTISAGGAITAASFFAGVEAGSVGTATVTGTGSSLSVSGGSGVNVGYSGTGTLAIEDGGSVTGIGAIGYETGSIGTVTVSGAGSLWSASSLTVGHRGTGTLRVENGGTVSGTGGTLGLFAGSSGTAIITGPGSTWELSSFLIVGQANNGTLLVENGGTVSSSSINIGSNASSNGTATVTGSGSTLTASGTLYVGFLGTGKLTISDGGAVSSAGGFIGNTSSSNGTVLVDGGSWNAGTSGIYVGYSGTGSLTVSDDGTLTSGGAFIGSAAGSSGTVTVTGADSSWTVNSGGIYVGNSGTGALTISDGATVTSGSIYVGRVSTGVGTLIVTGAGSSLDLGSTFLYAGSAGTGTVTIADGGAVSATYTYVGNNAGSNGTVNLEGTADARGVLTTRQLVDGAGTGQLNLDGGVLKAVADQTAFLSGFTSSSVEIKAGGAFIDSNGFAITIATDLDGVGGLTKLGSGTLTLSGTSTYTGGTRIEAGSLKISADANLGAASGNLAIDGGTLATTATFSSARDISLASAGGNIDTDTGTTLTLSGALSGDGGLTKTGAGTLVLTGTASYDGTTQIDSGTLQVSADDQLGGASSVIGLVNGTLATTGSFTSARAVSFTNAGTASIDTAPDTTLTLSGTLSGTGGFTKKGAGTLVLTGTNSYSGITQIESGTLEVSADAQLGGGSANIGFSGGTLATTASFSSDRSVRLGIAGGTIDTAPDATLTLTTGIGGNGGLTKQGDGTLTLTGSSSYSGATRISAGTLTLSGSGSIASSITVTLDGTLDVSAATAGVTLNNLSGSGTLVLGSQSLTATQTDSLSFTGTLEGSGTFAKAGTGSLILSGDNSGFTGSTEINAGALVVSSTGGTTSGTLGGDVRVASGGTLEGGGGSITGSATVASGGVLAGSQDGGTLSFGSLTLEAGAITNVTLSSATTSSAIFTTTGDLTVDGTLNVASAPGYGIGVYRVFSSGGTLTDNGLVLGTLPVGNYDTTLAVSSTAVDVVVAGIPTSLQYWSADGSSQGGAGIWTAANTWLNSDSTTAAWGGNTAVFSGTAGTVNVVGAQSFATLEFLSTGYEVAAGTDGSLDLGAGGQVWAEGVDVTATVSAAITGTGALSKVGEGTIILSGINSYAGGTVIVDGTLQVAADANLGESSGALTFYGGTLATTASFTSARAITVDHASNLSRAANVSGTIDTAAATTLILTGDISGTGGLIKEGEGTLVLAGTNTYSGVTTINAGTLQIGNGGTSGSIIGDVVNNSALVFNRSDTYSFPGTITGEGTVSFIGSGTVLFADPGAYTGAIQVSGSTVHLENETQSSSVFTLDAGALLSGNGTIGGLAANSGSVVAPGNSPGMITVTGAVAFNAGSVYRVDVTPEGEHDLISATGAVTLSSDATVVVVAVSGVYAPNATYTILTTTDAVSGTFGSVSSTYAFLTPELSYDAQNVYLTLTYNQVGFGTYAYTPNQAAVAPAAEALGSGNAVYDALLQLSEPEVAAAFDALGGEVYASTSTVIQQQSIYVREAVGARLRQAAAEQAGSVASPALAYAKAGPETAPLGAGLAATLWAQGYGGWGDSYGDGNAATISNTIGGFLIGADVAVADTARLGLFGGYSRSTFDVDARSSSGSMDNYDVGLYAGAQFGALGARGGLTYAWHDVSADRTIAFADLLQGTTADYSTDSLQVFGELGYQAQLSMFDVEPFVGVTYLHITGASFTESGGAAALSVDSGAMDTTYTTFGVRLAGALDMSGHVLTPSLTLGWQHAFGDITPSATMLFGGGLPFDVAGVPIAEDTLLLEAGLGYALSELSALSATYSGQFAGDASQNAFTARFALKF